MRVKDIKEFLVMVLDKEMEEEWRTTDEKEYIANCIEAKRWLLKGGMIEELMVQADIEKYMGDE